MPAPVCAHVARFAFPGRMLLVAFDLFTAALPARYALTRKASRA